MLGTGLGMPIVHAIVTKMGGQIQVESAPGEGTTFTLALPWNRWTNLSLTLCRRK